MAVEFNEGSDSFSTANLQQSVNDSFFVRLLKNSGIAQTTQQANAILIGVAILAFALSTFILWRTLQGPTPAELPPEEMMMQQENFGSAPANR
ncbi:MAG: hypothetical protein KatS3mg100_082 [Candidatus Parcubacteria bacterium]|nr:MAG: hypothetical protein KatS3mg100_082 [Candidatus Parcubacteria bacterium]